MTLWRNTYNIALLNKYGLLEVSSLLTEILLNLPPITLR